MTVQNCAECGTSLSEANEERPPSGPSPSAPSFAESLFSYEALQRQKQQGMQAALQRAQTRRCACGAQMSAASIRQYFLGHAVPCGHKLNYSCQACGRKMGIPSLAAMFWSSLGALIGGLPLAAMVRNWLQPESRKLPWLFVGITLAVGALFFFSAYTLVM